MSKIDDSTKGYGSSGIPIESFLGWIGGMIIVWRRFITDWFLLLSLKTCFWFHRRPNLMRGREENGLGFEQFGVLRF